MINEGILVNIVLMYYVSITYTLTRGKVAVSMRSVNERQGEVVTRQELEEENHVLRREERVADERTDPLSESGRSPRQ